MSHFFNNYCIERPQLLNNFFSIDFSSSGTAPITITEAKTHLNVTFSDDDTYLTALIKQCIDAIEQYTATSITPRTITILADIVKEFELPYGPVASFTSVSTKVDGTYTVSDPGNYTIDSIQFARYIPGTSGRVKLVYTAGYDATLPLSLKLAVLNEIAFRYENRGDGTNRYAQQNVGISEGAQALANPYRRLSWV